MDARALLGHQRKASLLRRLCCCCLPQEDERPRTRGTSLASPHPYISPTQEPRWKILDYASGRMYLIGQGPYRVFARFRHVDLGNDSSGSVIDPGNMSKPPEVSEDLWRARYECFSRFDEGLHIEPEDWNSVVPERVAKHMAKHCRASKVLDAACGVGECAIQFAKVAKVTALNENPAAIERAAWNASRYEVQGRIELKHGSFMELGPMLSADTVFIRTEAVSASMSDILTIAGTFAQVMLYLPKSVDPDHLAVLVAQCTELELTCEFDMFLMGEELKGVCCYLGDLAVLSREEMLRVMCHRLRVKDADASLLGRYFREVKLRSLMRVLHETESDGGNNFGTRYLKRLAADDECRLDELLSPRRQPSACPSVILRINERGYPQDEVLPMILEYCFLPFSLLKVNAKESDFELDGLPMLETNGKKLHSTIAIGRYLCHLNGLHPTDKLEVYYLEKTAAYLQTVSKDLYKAKVAGEFEDFLGTKVPDILTVLSGKVEKREGVGGTKPTLADFMLLEFLWKCKDCPLPSVLQDYQRNLCVDSLTKYQSSATLHGLINP